jgi:DNA-binding NarL/FixJ family response regulator
MPPPSPHPVLPSPPRVVIVDADRRVQDSLADLLGVSGDLMVVGRAGDVRSALEIVERTQPDAVLIDPRLPDIEAGEALMTGLALAWPELRVVLTGWADVDGHSLPSAPRSRYVSKSASPDAFVAAIAAACVAT